MLTRIDASPDVESDVASIVAMLGTATGADVGRNLRLVPVGSGAVGIHNDNWNRADKVDGLQLSAATLPCRCTIDVLA